MRFSRQATQARHARQATIDSRIDTESGEFDMVMASEGEAADGHIISMRGLETPALLPLQLDHGRSVISNLGNVSQIRKDKIEGLPVTRGVGRIRLTGEGEQLEARRDLVDAISRGDIRGVSLTWDSIKHTERRDLPRNHPAHVSYRETDPRKRYGIFFEAARAIEQSIVAIPADREALIGREAATENAISRAMWHSVVDRLSDVPRNREVSIIDALETTVADLEERLRTAEDTTSSDAPPTPPAFEHGLDALERQIGDWRARTQGELDDALGDVFQRLIGRPLQ